MVSCYMDNCGKRITVVILELIHAEKLQCLEGLYSLDMEPMGASPSWWFIITYHMALWIHMVLPYTKAWHLVPRHWYQSWHPARQIWSGVLQHCARFLRNNTALEAVSMMVYIVCMQELRASFLQSLLEGWWQAVLIGCVCPCMMSCTQKEIVHADVQLMFHTSQSHFMEKIWLSQKSLQKYAKLARFFLKNPDFGCKISNFPIFSQICFRLGRIITKISQNQPLVLYERNGKRNWYMQM